MMKKMTDEQKAEEYTDSINTLIYDIEDNAINIAKYLRKAYLDGLEEGKPKWHDLRKDPNDLPKESGNYWGYVNYYGFQYRTLWWSDNQFDVSEVIAWTELPKFEK